LTTLPNSLEHTPLVFDELFERTKNLVFRTAYLMMGDAGDAEEALQEVFVLVYRSLASYDPQKGAITTWLHRITINYCLSTLRKRRVTSQPLDVEHPGLVSDPADHSMARLADVDAVAQAVRSLNTEQRAAVVLRYYWELPYAEIAQVLGVPLGTVKSRLERAIKTLRRKLSDDETGARWDPVLPEEINP
jgi:RNA polymerase sigma-70 factor, ECF subfamily